jgi:hypothetical protein
MIATGIKMMTWFGKEGTGVCIDYPSEENLSDQCMLSGLHIISLQYPTESFSVHVLRNCFSSEHVIRSSSVRALPRAREQLIAQ